jgi:enamine deaminase RidA (YjgF/YER057c/UK114 family)
MHKANIRHNPTEVSPGFETIYAHAVEIPAGARTLHVSGQIGRTADGTVPEDFEGQFRLAIANLNQVLEGAGMGTGDIAKLTFFLTDPAHLVALGHIRRETLSMSPAVTTLVVAGLAAPNLLVEVEAIAARA